MISVIHRIRSQDWHGKLAVGVEGVEIGSGADACCWHLAWQLKLPACSSSLSGNAW